LLNASSGQTVYSFSKAVDSFRPQHTTRLNSSATPPKARGLGWPRDGLSNAACHRMVCSVQPRASSHMRPEKPCRPGGKRLNDEAPGMHARIGSSRLPRCLLRGTKLHPFRSFPLRLVNSPIFQHHQRRSWARCDQWHALELVPSASLHSSRKVGAWPIAARTRLVTGTQGARSGHCGGGGVRTVGEAAEEHLRQGTSAAAPPEPDRPEQLVARLGFRPSADSHRSERGSAEHSEPHVHKNNND